MATDYDEQFTNMVTQTRADFEKEVEPLIDELSAESNSREIINNNTSGNTLAKYDAALGQSTRARQLYGQQANEQTKYQQNIGRELTVSGNYSNAVRTQYERNGKVQNQLASLQNIIENKAFSGMANAAKAETDIANYNEQVAAENKGNTFKQVAGVAAGAVVGFYTGNPYAGVATYGAIAGS